VSRFSNHHLRALLRYLIWMSLFGAACFCVSHAQFHDGGSFLKVLLGASWGVFAEWPAVWASVMVILLAGCVLYLVLALDELLPLFKRDCFSAGMFYGLMLLPVGMFGTGSFCLARALF
jgi:hypothetical protein